MTREEALIQLRLGPGINEDVSEEYNEAVNMAIEALKSQPSDDEKVIRISKGALKARTGKYVIYDVEWLKEHFNTTEAKIYGQPKEELQQKTGHWEWVQYESKPNFGNWHCSECRCILRGAINGNPIRLPKYCPECGAKMQEEKK